MTIDEIYSWCMDHATMKSRLAYNDDKGRLTVFENGDSYEYRERNYSFSEKTVDYIINGETVNTTVFRWCNFGWQPV